MRRLLVSLAFTAVAQGGASAQTVAAPVPAPAASRPTTPYKRIHPIPPPQPPAVQRSKEATIPGDLQPEPRTVPQIRIPLGKGSYSHGTTGGVDDSVARCRAKRTSEERESCEAGLDGI
jgi:hypothetical protein